MKILEESYELHNELNPKLYNKNNLLKPEVLNKLTEISNEFIEYIELPLNIVDIEIVGSNASYNYSNTSDIDLHIIVNSEVNFVDSNILRELYNLKKSSFNDKYDINIYDIPVELYIEDVSDGNATNGRYSILKNDWVKQPVKIKYEIPDIANELMSEQEKIIDILDSEDEQAILNEINNIYMNRKFGLAEEGETSVYNLIFKELRSSGLIQQLKDRYYELKGKDLSID